MFRCVVGCVQLQLEIRGMASVMKAGGGPVKWQMQQLRGRRGEKNRTQQAVSPISNYGCLKLHASSGSMPMVFRTNLSPKVRLERGISCWINWSWNLTWRLNSSAQKSVCVLPSISWASQRTHPNLFPPGPSEGSKVVT